MTTILLRTLIIYIILICSMRLMGKRQIGELEVSELVSTLILSEIASIPIENQEIPVGYAIIPIVTITTLEIVVSVILVKFPKIKNFLAARPSVLIENGVINQKELIRSRISAEELIGELRQKDISDINEVNYAILEQNGKISVTQKAKYKTPTLSDIGKKANETGIMHILVSNGYINKYNLQKHDKSEEWLRYTVKKSNCDISDVFLLLIDDSGNTCLIKKDEKK